MMTIKDIHVLLKDDLVREIDENGKLKTTTTNKRINYNEQTNKQNKGTNHS